MTDGFPDRITQLRARWQADPSSRVFLQLAEEYRHLGRVQDALAVLESGLKEHPGYLSALVAQGRCLLELGESGKARGVLERVVQQDATQMVASKLLVRAYIESNDPERARQRLDLYRLLNDSDPEIEELHRRVVAMSRPPQAPDGPRPEEPAERPRMDSTETPAAEVFDLGPAKPARSLAAEEDLFGLGSLLATLPPAPAAAAPPQSGAMPPPAGTPQSGAAAPPAATPQAASPAAAAAASLAGGGATTVVASLAGIAGAAYGGSNGADPFPDPVPEESRRRYLAGFAAEGIFSFQGGAGEEEPGPHAGLAAAPAAVAGPVEPLPPPAESRATLTLGELYLRQGHLEEAERIFGEIAHRDPDNAAAREALADIARRARPAPAAAPPAAPQPAAPASAETPAAAAEPEPELQPPSQSPAMAAEPPAPAAVEPPAAVDQPTALAAGEPLATVAAPPAAIAQTAAAAAAAPPVMPASAVAPASAAPAAGEPGPAGGPRLRPLEAGHLLAGMADPQAAPTARKAYLLQSYLARLRQPRRHNVP